MAGIYVSPKCGTIEGFRQHRRNGVPYPEIDRACKDARNAQVRESQAYQQSADTKKLNNRIRWKALTTLASEYPERYAELLAEVRHSEEEHAIFEMFQEVHDEGKNDGASAG